MTATRYQEFAKVYNNLDLYPTLDDVAHKLNSAMKTVANTASTIRGLKGTKGIPALVSRRSKPNVKDPKSRAEYQNTLDKVTAHGNIGAAAEAMKIGEVELRRILRRAEGMGLEPSDEAIKAGRTSFVTNDTPMSEDPTRYKEDWGKQDCIDELRRIANIDPERVVSRNHFRNHSKISESTWNRYFGTFEEFKRAADIKLSRAAHRLERDIAKHASIDGYRLMTAEKRNWASNYEKPNGSRFKTAMICNDVHDIECSPWWRYLFIETLKRVQPDRVILNGDIFDLPEFGKYPVDPREWDVVGRIKWVHRFLADIRDAVPDAEIYFMEGNHEYRLLRHLADQTPALKAVLADLHGFTVPKLLGLTDYEINYVAPADLATFTKADMEAEIKRNWMDHWGCFITHHFPEGKNFGMPGLSGHHHGHEMWSFFSAIYGPCEWHQVGSGHKREASYCNGEKWSNGFMLAHCDVQERRTVFDYANVTQDHAVIGGKWYLRSDYEDEILAAA